MNLALKRRDSDADLQVKCQRQFHRKHGGQGFDRATQFFVFFLLLKAKQNLQFWVYLILRLG